MCWWFISFQSWIWWENSTKAQLENWQCNERPGCWENKDPDRQWRAGPDFWTFLHALIHQQQVWPLTRYFFCILFNKIAWEAKVGPPPIICTHDNECVFILTMVRLSGSWRDPGFSAPSRLINSAVSAQKLFKGPRPRWESARWNGGG